MTNSRKRHVAKAGASPSKTIKPGSDPHAARPGRRWPQGASLFLDPVNIQPLIGQRPSKGRTQDAIYEQLRHMILNGDVPPRAWLRQDELTRTFGVSRTPVREVLRMLSQEGLVEMVANQGFQVAPLSMEAFEELYALRVGIEGFATRIAIARLVPGDLAKLRTQFAELRVLAVEAELFVYLRYEWSLRLSLYEVTHRERLLVQIKTLREHAERYLRLAYTDKGRVEESLEFHRQLIKACERGDTLAGETIVQNALRWTVSRAGPIIAMNIAPESAPPSPPLLS